MAIPTPTADKVSLTTHLHEYSYVLPRCTGLTLKARLNTSNLYIYFVANGNGLPAGGQYMTIPPGGSFTPPGMWGPCTFYFQSDTDGDAVELVYLAA